MSVDAQGSQMVAAQSVEIVGQLRGPGNRLSGGSVGSLAKKCRASVGRESGPIRRPSQVQPGIRILSVPTAHPHWESRERSVPLYAKLCCSQRHERRGGNRPSSGRRFGEAPLAARIRKSGSVSGPGSRE